MDENLSKEEWNKIVDHFCEKMKEKQSKEEWLKIVDDCCE